MWIIQEANGTLHDRSALPSQNMLGLFRGQFPGARILRSLEPCHNEFGALAFAKEWIQDGERAISVTAEDGTVTTITEPVMVLRRVPNTYTLNGTTLEVLSEAGAVLGTFPLEVVYDGADGNQDAT